MDKKEYRIRYKNDEGSTGLVLAPVTHNKPHRTAFMKFVEAKHKEEL